MTKKYRTDKEAPSDLFVDSIGFGTGSADMECGWCDRMHLCPDTDYDPPDYCDTNSIDDDRKRWYKYCIDEQKKNPNGVILHFDSDGVMGKQINGINFVVGCPCNGLSRFEKFIWNERNTIREYLKKRINQEYEWYLQEKTKNKLAGIERGEDKDKESMWY